MTSFEIKDDFYLDGKPFKILSGAVHYFRVHPTDWYHSLYNLKALGFNTVETYVPWNMHEPKEETYQFEGMLDIEKFLQIAQDLGLYAIVRPSPYICAEWEFGGFPAWLLEKPIRIRSSESGYLAYVKRYYAQLIPKLADHQIDRGGNILMMQIENEYGSYGEDKDYLRAIKQLLIDLGVTVPLFTSDGAWQATLRAGSMIEENVLPTGNFGSNAKGNLANVKAFMDEHDKVGPLMCMEFWDGWFNRWKEDIIKRDAQDLADSVKEALEIGSVNLYMFHGGTNFGFMNGCSARGVIDLPQVTSYDYDAPLDEQGNPTPKYFALQKMVHELFPDLEQKEPLVKESMELLSIPLANKVSLFNTLDKLAKPITSLYPQSMEKLGQTLGYLLYRTTIQKDAQEERFRVIDGRDRIQFFIDGKLEATQYQTEIGEDIMANVPNERVQIDVLVENMGRVNYGHKLLADTQRKGIRTGVTADLHFLTNWQHYCLPLDNPGAIDFSGEWQEGVPAFYLFEFDLDKVEDTYIDLSKFGKGIAFMNGYNLGRYWQVGPIQSLYVPKGMLKTGQNKLIVFDTEGQHAAHIDLIKTHKLKKED